MIRFAYTRDRRRALPYRFRTTDWRAIGSRPDPEIEAIHTWVEVNATGRWDYRVCRSDRLGFKILYNASFRFDLEVDAVAFKIRWV